MGKIYPPLLSGKHFLERFLFLIPFLLPALPHLDQLTSYSLVIWHELASFYKIALSISVFFQYTVRNSTAIQSFG